MSEANMYRLAARRGRVVIDMPDGKTRTATLVAWRPHDGRTRARVLFDNGARRTVKASQVHGPTQNFRSVAGQLSQRYGDGSYLPVPVDEVVDIEDMM